MVLAIFFFFSCPATCIPAMAVTQIKEKSVLDALDSLATWVRYSAKMQQDNKLLKCVDDDRLARTLPILEGLGYDQQVS